MNAALTMDHINHIAMEPVSRPLAHALNVVEAMGDAGLTAVPLKPSATMLAAGARAGGVTVETAWKIYQAMIREGH